MRAHADNLRSLDVGFSCPGLQVTSVIRVLSLNPNPIHTEMLTLTTTHRVLI